MTTDDHDAFEEATLELDGVEQEFALFTKRRVVIWVLRWIIGFSIIAAVVYVKPEWAWLWSVGILLALLTPVSAIIARRVVARKLAQARRSVQQAKTYAEQSIDDG